LNHFWHLFHFSKLKFWLCFSKEKMAKIFQFGFLSKFSLIFLIIFFMKSSRDPKKAFVAICIFIVGLSISFISLNREFKDVAVKYERFERKIEKQYSPVIESRLIAGQRKLHSFQDQFNIFMQMGVAEKAARKKEIDLIKGVELLEDNL
ncbi:unnamed protein product, partial [Oikopleura dioica]